MNIGGGRKIFERGGGVACPRRHLLALPLWCPEGRRAPGGTCYPCRCGARRGDEPPGGTCYPCRCGAGGATSPRRHWLSLPLRCRRGNEPPAALAIPAVWFLSCPQSPQPHSPAGKGGTKVIFMQGASPLASPGLSPGGTCSPCHCGARRGGEPPAALAVPALACLLAPIPPPPFPAGRGRLLLYFAGGYRPRHPGIRPLAALTEPPKQAPGGGVPSASPVRRKTDRIAFLSAMPAAKERGDRGRGTSAFEMVLSPGAGIASAAGKSALRAQGWGLSFPAGEGGQEGKLKAG